MKIELKVKLDSGAEVFPTKEQAEKIGLFIKREILGAGKPVVGEKRAYKKRKQVRSHYTSEQNAKILSLTTLPKFSLARRELMRELVKETKRSKRTINAQAYALRTKLKKSEGYLGSVPTRVPVSSVS